METLITNEEITTAASIAIKTVTIKKPAEELYGFWRQLENLPRISRNLESVTQTSSTQSHWVARGPLEKPVQWDAEIVSDEPGRRLQWKTKPGSEIEHTGEILFRPAPASQGTEVVVTMEYAPPGGPAGVLVAKVFGKDPQQQLCGDLGRFKALMEAGDIPTTDGQPTGRNVNEQ